MCLTLSERVSFKISPPGGNATGFVNFEYGIGAKWLELLRQIAPSVARAGVIRDPAITAGTGQFGAIQAVAPSLGFEVVPLPVREPEEIGRSSLNSLALRAVASSSLAVAWQ